MPSHGAFDKVSRMENARENTMTQLRASIYYTYTYRKSWGAIYYLYTLDFVCAREISKRQCRHSKLMLFLSPYESTYTNAAKLAIHFLIYIIITLIYFEYIMNGPRLFLIF